MWFGKQNLYCHLLLKTFCLQIREINSNWRGCVTKSRDSLQSWLAPDKQCLWIMCLFSSQQSFSPMVDPTMPGLYWITLTNPVKRNFIPQNSSESYTGLNLIPKLGTPKLGLWIAQLGFLGTLEGVDFDQPHLNFRTESKGRNHRAVTIRERWRLIRQNNKCAMCTVHHMK